MSSTTFFIIFIPILSILLLFINLILAPHNPYQEKDSVFECGFKSFLGQNRTQFSVSFFIFGLLFLLFDLEILLVYPYSVSGYSNDIYGLIIMVIFFVLLTLGFIFELGKNALDIDSKQAHPDTNVEPLTSDIFLNSPHALVLSALESSMPLNIFHSIHYSVSTLIYSFDNSVINCDATRGWETYFQYSSNLYHTLFAVSVWIIAFSVIIYNLYYIKVYLKVNLPKLTDFVWRLLLVMINRPAQSLTYILYAFYAINIGVALCNTILVFADLLNSIDTTAMPTAIATLIEYYTQDLDFAEGYINTAEGKYTPAKTDSHIYLSTGTSSGDSDIDDIKQNNIDERNEDDLEWIEKYQHQNNKYEELRPIAQKADRGEVLTDEEKLRWEESEENLDGDYLSDMGGPSESNLDKEINSNKNRIAELEEKIQNRNDPNYELSDSDSNDNDSE